MSNLFSSALVENCSEGLKTISASSITDWMMPLVPISLLKNENVAAIVDEPSGVEVSTNDTIFSPSRPTLPDDVVPLFTKRTSAVATFSQVRNEASTAANSLPFTNCGEPLSFIQYETGIDGHFGVCPEEAVMRV